MPINVPNPYGVDVAISPAGGRAVGLQAAPETRYNKNRLAADLMEQGKEFVKKLDEWQSQIDVTRGKDLINQLEESRIDLRTNPETGYSTLQGVNALERPSGKSLQEEVSESFRTKYDEIRAKASTPRQRQIVDEYYQAASNKLGQDVGSWVIRQQEVYANAVDEQMMRTAARKAMSDDPDEQRDGEYVIRDMLARKEKREGVPQDVARYMGPIHLNRVAGMADGYDIDGANAYLERYRDEMTPAGYERAKSMIGRAKDQRDIEAATNSIVAGYGSEREAMEAVKQYPRAIRDRIRSNIREHFAVVAREQRLREKEATSAAWDYIVSEGKMPPASMLEDLDGKTVASMQSHLDRRAAKIEAERKRVEKLRSEDPVFAAIDEGRFGFTPIEDWSSSNVAAEMQKRAEFSDELKDSYGLRTRPLLTNSEVDSLVSQVSKMDPDQQADVLSSVTRALNGDQGAIGAFAAQLGSKNARYGTAVYLMSEDFALGPQYLQGKRFIDEKRVAIPNTGEGSRSTFYELIGDEDGVVGLTKDIAVNDLLTDACQGLWAYGQVQSSNGVESAEDAVEKVVGRIETWNGKKVIMPKRANGEYYDSESWTSKSFEDLMDDKIAALRGQKGEVVMSVGGTPSRVSMELFAKNLGGMQLQSQANGRYFVLDTVLGFVRNADGTPYVLDVLPKEQK